MRITLIRIPTDQANGPGPAFRIVERDKECHVTIFVTGEVTFLGREKERGRGRARWINGLGKSEGWHADCMLGSVVRLLFLVLGNLGIERN